MKNRDSFDILVINWQDITHPMGGGAEVHFHEIFKRVVAAGHKVTLLCCSYPKAPKEEVIDGIKIVRRGQRDFFNYYVPRAYRELSNNQNYDIVFDDINKIPFYTPFYVKQPIVAIVHHFFGKSIFLEVSMQYAMYVYLSEWLVRYVYRKTPFAVVSQSTKKELIKIGIRSKIDLLPNAVDFERFYVQTNSKSVTPLIGYLGRIKKYKSVDHIIQAFKHILVDVPNARLMIVGEGDNRDELEKLTHSLSLENSVTFTGHVSQEEKTRLLNQMWLVINPSSKEGWGLTVIEANACRVPVVAADSPGLRDSVIHGKTGTLYEYGNLNQMTLSAIELIKNHKKRKLYSDNAYKWAQSFNWQNSAIKAIELIKENVL